MNQQNTENKRRSRHERGEGAWIIILFLVGLGVVWFVGNFIISSIYDSKEARVEQSHEAHEAHGKGKNKVTPPTIEPTPKELGSYTVEFDK